MSEPLFDPETDDLQDEIVENIEPDNDGPVEHEEGQDDGS